MHYESLRDKGSQGQPSLTEMTNSAIRILNNKKNKNGYVLMVEGGKIDQAHHQVRENRTWGKSWGVKHVFFCFSESCAACA